jgi:ABC-type transport system involved in multi-copper enzyme maturation permease subunit
MGRLKGIFRHEFGMSIRRKSLWVAYGSLFIFHTVLLYSPPPLGEWVAGQVIPESDTWSVAGRFLVALNVFFPVVAGILSADRIQRDGRSGLRELQASTPLRARDYILAKYLAALASTLLPLFVWVMVIAIEMTVSGHTSIVFLYAVPAAFLAITVPAFAFVVASSLACPLVLPLSVYQILFTGYWFWANFIPSALFPTLNGTLFTPSGMFALQGLFGGPVSEAIKGTQQYTPLDAVLNLVVLSSCIVVVLVLLERHLARQARRA